MQLRNERGFTLIEIAIVLTIVGLVIGGIWLAASTVIGNNKKATVSRQVIQIVQNAKSLFANQTGNNPATNFTTTDAIKAGVFPSGMIRNNNTVYHPFATVLTQPSVTLEGAGNQLTLTIGNSANGRRFPEDACLELVTRVATEDNFSRFGIVSVNGITQGSNVNALSATCNGGGGNSNNPVVIVFNVP